MPEYFWSVCNEWNAPASGRIPTIATSQFHRFYLNILCVDIPFVHWPDIGAFLGDG